MRQSQWIPCAAVAFALSFAACSAQPAPQAAAAGDATSGGEAMTQEAAAATTAAEAEATPRDEAPAEPAADPAAGVGPVPTPPADGQWLVDETGRRYFIDKVEKIEGRYERLEDGVVKPWRMPALKLESEDDRFFYFRVYEPQTVEPWRRRPEVSEEARTRYDGGGPTADVDTLTFEPFDEGLPKTGQWRNGFALVDMNGDGHVDIVHGPARKSLGTPVIFLGDDAGTWRNWDDVTFPSKNYDYGDVAVGDFNGDGVPDFALAMHLTGILALEHDGKGNFQAASEGLGLLDGTGRQKLDFSGREIESVDWDGDGRPDLMVLSEGPATMPRGGGDNPAPPAAGVRLYRNLGAGRWEAAATAPEDRSFGESLVLADLDGDGRTDVVTGSRTIGYRDVVKMGQADGTWANRALDPLPERPLVWSVTSGDFDGDGRPDLAVGYRDTLWEVRGEVVDVLLNRSEPGELRWERRMTLLQEGEDYEHFGAMATGDVDGDGNTDLVALDDVGRRHVLLGNGDGSFRRELSPELEPTGLYRHCAGYEVQLLDLDGDGRDEILAGFAGEPGTEAYLIGVLEPRCRASGALHVWHPVPAGSGG